MSKTDNNLQSNITDMLKNMLAKGCVDALLVPQGTSTGEGVVQSLVTDGDKLEHTQPLSLVMPVNSGTIISNLTKVAPSHKTIAAVLKPCEIRALIELVKLKQASLDNIVIIGVDCPGTYAVSDYRNMIAEEKSPWDTFIKNAQQGKDDENLREACRVCEYPVPENADIIMGIYGSDLKNPIVMAPSKTGKEILKVLGIEPQEESPQRSKAVDNLRKRRLEAWTALLTATEGEVAGIENLLKFFDACINCHNCMDVCPVCYCRECFFDSPTFEYEADRYLSWAQKKGIVKMPRDTLMFHFTRMNHLATSCVGCGMCEQACPSSIKLLRLYKTVGHNAQQVFAYVPGKSLDDELPLITFREEELEPK